jgi:hypothetical protein
MSPGPADSGRAEQVLGHPQRRGRADVQLLSPARPDRHLAAAPNPGTAGILATRLDAVSPVVRRIRHGWNVRALVGDSNSSPPPEQAWSQLRRRLLAHLVADASVRELADRGSLGRLTPAGRRRRAAAAPRPNYWPARQRVVSSHADQGSTTSRRWSSGKSSGKRPARARLRGVLAGGRDRFRTCGLCRDAPVDGQVVLVRVVGGPRAVKTSRAM